MSLGPDEFRAVLGRFATGVTVVTVASAGEDHGMTVSAFASVSLEPPLIVVCIDKSASIHDLLVSCEHFGVNMLAEDQEAIARRFAETGAQRFNGIGYRSGENGVPLLDDVVAWLECRRVSSQDAGDHTLIVGETSSGGANESSPLLYFRGGFTQLGR